MTSPEIGFAIVSHRQPAQLARLVQALGRVFGPVPIACHHDHAQSRIPSSLAPALKHVHFVRHPVRTAWARFSVVEATALAMNTLMRDAIAPRWGVVLTGADYPIANATRVLNDLNSATVDAWIEHRRIDPASAADAHTNNSRRGPLGANGYAIGEGARNERLCRQRYFGTPISFPWVHGQTLTRRLFRHPPYITDLPVPFSTEDPCFVGCAYFSFTRRVNDFVQRAISTESAMRQWYRDRFAPDESFLQTMLANNDKLTLGNASYRYVDWTAQKRHPKVLDSSDVSTALASGMHFARKVDGAQSAGFMDAIDDVLRNARTAESSP